MSVSCFPTSVAIDGDTARQRCRRSHGALVGKHESRAARSRRASRDMLRKHAVARSRTRRDGRAHCVRALRFVCTSPVV